MAQASKNIKEDLKKNRPNKLPPIINTIISASAIIVVIILKIVSKTLSWPLFIGFIIVLTLFPIASWYNSYFSKKQKTKMLYNYEKETERILEFMQHKKHYKAFEESDKIKVNVAFSQNDDLPTYTYNKEISSLGFLNHDYALLTIGIGFAGVEVDPNSKQIVNMAGLLPRSIWLKKKIKTPTPTIKANVYVETQGVDIRSKTYLQINKQDDTYYNPKTGWLCIGYYKTYSIDDVVEFMENSYLVIRDNKIISMWIYVGENLPLY